MSEPLDPAAVMAEHYLDPDFRISWCVACGDEWPCLPYRLADALGERDQQIAYGERMAESLERQAAALPSESYAAAAHRHDAVIIRAALGGAEDE